MVHTNVDITGRAKFFNTKLKNTQLFFRAGKIFLVDLFLRLESLWQMGVVLDGDPVRIHMNYLVQCLGKTCNTLMRQTVDQIYTD